MHQTQLAFRLFIARQCANAAYAVTVALVYSCVVTIGMKPMAVEIDAVLGPGDAYL